MPRFHAASYPGWRADGPVLVYGGEVHPVPVDGDVSRPVTGPVDAPVLTADEACWVVAYGANACPDRLIDKELDGHGALLLPARLTGWRPAFEGRRTSYGAVPLTLLPDPVSDLEVWVLGLGRDDVDRLDQTEGRQQGRYTLGPVGSVPVADRFLLDPALAYLPGPTARVLVAAGGYPSWWPETTQTAAAAAVDRGDLAVASPTGVTGAEPGVGWPRTPLLDLPLFVYGTLAPGEVRWSVVSDFVGDVEAAVAAGTLHDTGYGWPAACFGRSDAGQVHGHLLTPAGADAARELYRRCDEVEGAPRLFQRTTVAVQAGGEQRWAASYVWASGRTPPGRRVSDGRWQRA